MLTGLLASVSIDYITDYYTGRDRSPVIRIANASQTGSATNIITGLAVGLETAALPIISLGAALITSYYLGTLFGKSIGIDPFYRRNIWHNFSHHGNAGGHGHGFSS